MKDAVAKYDLYLVQDKNEFYTRAIIRNLKSVSYRKDKVEIFSGASGLLKQIDYPGYCFLYAVYYEQGSSQFGDDGLTIHFAPLYNEKGEQILVRYNRDAVSCSVYYRNLGCEIVFY